MNRTWFIGDTHFGSHKIAKHEYGETARPLFNDAYEHDKWLIDLWNSTVGKKDVVYVMGDIAMTSKRAKDVFPRLVGIKHLILGNHDQFSVEDLRLAGFKWRILSSMRFKEDWVLTHIPIHPTQLEYKWKKNIHGHIHQPSKYPAIQQDSRYINVNLCATGRLVSFDEIKEMA